MKVAGHPATEEGAEPLQAAESAGEAREETLAGDRGIPSINRARSLEARVSSVLALSLMSALGLGLLTWYSARTLTRPAQAQHAAQAAVKSRAQGEMALPRLPPIAAPLVAKEPQIGRAHV